MVKENLSGHAEEADGESRTDSSSASYGLEKAISFRDLMSAYTLPISRYVRRFVGSDQDVEDVVQEVFINVYKRIDLVEAAVNQQTLKAFVFRIAHNTALNYLRSRNTQRRRHHPAPSEELESEEGELADSGQDPAALLVDGEKLARLRGAIASLPDQMRQCMVLRTYMDLDYKDIAERMNISINTVKSHLHQAKGQLRARLGDDWGG